MCVYIPKFLVDIVLKLEDAVVVVVVVVGVGLMKYLDDDGDSDDSLEDMIYFIYLKEDL
jgi:hypothetical protein